MKPEQAKANYSSDENEDDDDSSSDSGFDLELDEPLTTIKDQAAKDTKKTLARNETKAVSALRYIFVLVLLATALAVSLATYFYAVRVEEDAFQAEFDNVAEVTQRSFVEAVERRLNALDTFSSGITSHANNPSNTDSFPNVTLPDWEVKGAQLRVQTDGIYAFWLPLVTDETRAGYEAYTKQMQGHVFQDYGKEEMARQFQDMYFNISKEAPPQAQAEEAEEGHDDHDDHDHRQLHVGDYIPGMADFHMTIHDGIWGLHPVNTTNGTLDWLERPDTGPYLPCWQLSPVIPLPATINFNFLNYGDLKPTMEQAISSKKATLAYLQTQHEGSDTEDLINVFMTLNQYRHDEITYVANNDPLTQVAYPVFDSLSAAQRNVTGLVVSTIFWRLLLEDILADNIRGVIVVLKNTLGQAYTYRIDGKHAALVGEGDLHDQSFNDMGVTRHLADYLTQRASPNRWSYTSVGLDDVYNSYSVSVYPSRDTENEYITNDPILYSVIVGSIFVFTSLVFLLYDWLVEKRQSVIMDKAVKSTAVVTSLFPEAVHERLFADNSKSEEFSKEMAWKNTDGNDKTQSLEFLMNGQDQQRQARKRKKTKGKPIADKFTDVSVLFADLAGFTKWSSVREPEEVFELLEACYGAFDKIALRRHVFKVETIGDCYMACTGLPNPQADHAPRMVKFARDCMMRMERLLEEDLAHLGADTKELGFRVGVHSGPVTAGVLRGDKGRFQLFGDTVNTASRMESNGTMGRIHVSDSTAALLPERWIEPREDKIVAKGKGEMQTYWVQVSGRAQSSAAGGFGFDATVCSSTGDGDDEDNVFGEEEEKEERTELMKRFSFIPASLRNSVSDAVNAVSTSLQDELSEEFLNEVDV